MEERGNDGQDGCKTGGTGGDGGHQCGTEGMSMGQREWTWDGGGDGWKTEGDGRDGSMTEGIGVRWRVLC